MTVRSIKLTLLLALLSYCLVEIFTGAVSAHGSRPAQNRQEAPAGKRKSLHEYSPEEIIPEAQENENTRPGKDPAQQPGAGNGTPLASRPTPAPTVTPTPAPTVTPTPTPAESAVPVAAMTPSEPRKVKNPGAIRRKLLVSSALFLSLLLTLVFFVTRMLRQLREDREAATAPISQTPPPAAEKQQLRADGQAAVDRRVKRLDKVPKGLKNRMRKARHT